MQHDFFSFGQNPFILKSIEIDSYGKILLKTASMAIDYYIFKNLLH